MFIRISRFACTEVRSENDEDESVWPFSFLASPPAIGDDSMRGKVSAMLFDRQSLDTLLRAEER